MLELILGNEAINQIHVFPSKNTNDLLTIWKRGAEKSIVPATVHFKYFITRSSLIMFIDKEGYDDLK